MFSTILCISDSNQNGDWCHGSDINFQVVIDQNKFDENHQNPIIWGIPVSGKETHLGAIVNKD